MLTHPPSRRTTDGTPYLLQLGLSKSRTSAVWIAGPLSGLIMAPLVGVFADNSTSRWGRRRPYMLLGVVLSVLSLGVLGWARELVGLVLRDEEAVSVLFPRGRERRTITIPVFAATIS